MGNQANLMSHAVRRAPSGHRCGASHPRGRKYPDALVAEARRRHRQGIGITTLSRLLAVPERTLADWISYATRPPT